ncbi:MULTISPECIES: L-ribulose-5-phosphate 4-epimerase [unclassified Spirosoma]|uniref:L-ribulose-5-phosphate 4-epimerase n=1 Tax=unclassified Spirosoma TaxID=2621999 RepID=UPI0009641912|nr:MULTISPECIES: L-ribulose-5-phosphate 4-epimerase [unclassified Spirosoma]MBN8820991.1 L-ribulose-5-phosphate 4-epimerase [Spirosoma sp.]OJW75996.1 MAG: L-ribulose-5-phosphate 4-epimerase [Spirosoma sp. 48-14]
MYTSLKEECYEANMQLPKLGLVLFTFGNVSAVDRDRAVFAIKPSGVAYEELTPYDIVICDYDGKVIEGTMRPSSDTKTHALLYKTWDKIGGISHTHSTHAVAWAQAGMDIPIFGTTHADHTHQDIPCAPALTDEMIQGDYEHETGNQIFDVFAQKGLSYSEMEMVLLQNHGPFTWGKTAAKAVYNSAVLEEVARMAYLTLQINPNTPRIKDTLRLKHYERKHGKNAYYGQGC